PVDPRTRTLLPPAHQRAEDARHHETPDPDEEPDDPGEAALQSAPARLARIISDRDRRARPIAVQDAAGDAHVRVQPPPEGHAPARVPAAIHAVLVQDSRFEVR